MNDQPKSSIPPEPILTDDLRKRIVLEERLKLLTKPAKFGRIILIASVLCFVSSIAMGIYNNMRGISFKDSWDTDLTPWGVLLYLLLILGAGQLLRTLNRARIERELATKITTQKTEELQEKLDQNFFTNLVKINFKYIDQYYLQTQVQADKSFMLCALAACTSLLVIVAGIVLLFVRQTGKEAGYVATASGTLGEFIAAVFFYLYNRTITKMGEYHQKLVLTQNISLALKISEELPAAEQVASRTKLIDYLSKDINLFLTAKPQEIEKPK